MDGAADKLLEMDLQLSESSSGEEGQGTEIFGRFHFLCRISCLEKVMKF